MERLFITGAGPTGLAAALFLIEKGYDLTIIDKKPARTAFSKAVAMNARSLMLLEEVGVTDRLLAVGIKLFRMNFRYRNEILLRVDFSSLSHRYNFMLALPQSETEAILEQALSDKGKKVCWGSELIEFSQGMTRVGAVYQEKDIMIRQYYDFFLGADGSHSTVRQEMGLDFVGKRYQDEWNLIDLQLETPFASDEGNIILHDDGVILLIVPIAKERYRVVSNTKQALDYLPDGCEMGSIFWQSNFSVSCRQVPHYQDKRVFLLGDAAHIHSPAGGRGMNLGIEDAYIFAEMLSKDRIRDYSVQRHAKGASVISDTDRLFRIASMKNPLARFFRDHLLFNLLRNVSIQRRILPRMVGL